MVAELVEVQKISELHPTFSFTEFDFYRNYRQSFLCSELGRLHAVLPLKALADEIGLKENHLGRTCYYSPESKLALMFLKSYILNIFMS
jgi:hypothetical protein